MTIHTLAEIHEALPGILGDLTPTYGTLRRWAATGKFDQALAGGAGRKRYDLNAVVAIVRGVSPGPITVAPVDLPVPARNELAPILAAIELLGARIDSIDQKVSSAMKEQEERKEASALAAGSGPAEIGRLASEVEALRKLVLRRVDDEIQAWKTRATVAEDALRAKATDASAGAPRFVGRSGNAY